MGGNINTIPGYTSAAVSPQGKVNKADLMSVAHNMVVFLAPLVLVYLLQVSGTLQSGDLGINDLIPNKMTLGAMELYVVNALTDLLRKFNDVRK